MNTDKTNAGVICVHLCLSVANNSFLSHPENLWVIFTCFSEPMA
jgi:hypothetical protein